MSLELITNNKIFKFLYLVKDHHNQHKQKEIERS